MWQICVIKLVRISSTSHYGLAADDPSTRRTCAAMRCWGGRMPRYCFHVVEGEQHLPDEQGQELAGLPEAHTYALRLIEKFLRFLPDWPAADCRIRITLASGETVLTV